MNYKFLKPLSIYGFQFMVYGLLFLVQSFVPCSPETSGLCHFNPELGLYGDSGLTCTDVFLLSFFEKYNKGKLTQRIALTATIPKAFGTEAKNMI